MQCRDCQRLKDSDGRVGWCTARGRYRYLVDDVMGRPYFEEKEMKKMCSFEINCQALKPTYIPEELEPHPDTKRLDWLAKITGIKRSQRKLILTGTEWYDDGIWRLEIFDPLGDLEFEHTVMDEDSEKDYTFEEFLAEALAAYEVHRN